MRPARQTLREGQLELRSRTAHKKCVNMRLSGWTAISDISTRDRQSEPQRRANALNELSSALIAAASSALRRLQVAGSDARL